MKLRQPHHCRGLDPNRPTSVRHYGSMEKVCKALNPAPANDGCKSASFPPPEAPISRAFHVGCRGPWILCSGQGHPTSTVDTSPGRWTKSFRRRASTRFGISIPFTSTVVVPPVLVPLSGPKGWGSGFLLLILSHAHRLFQLSSQPHHLFLRLALSSASAFASPSCSHRLPLCIASSCFRLIRQRILLSSSPDRSLGLR